MTIMLTIVILALCSLIPIFISNQANINEKNQELRENAPKTNYEITLNEKDVYFCEDYRLPKKVKTAEGEWSLEHEENDYVFIYENGVEVVSSEDVDSFKVKEIKTNWKCLDF